MVINLVSSSEYHPGYVYSGFFVCVISFVILLSPALTDRAWSEHGVTQKNNIQLTFNRGSFEPYQSSYQPRQPNIRGEFLNEHAKVELFRTETKIKLPHGDSLALSGNIYTLRLYDFFSSITSSMEVSQRVNSLGLGMTGSLSLPIVQHDRWSIHINGHVSRSLRSPVSRPQSNRWNFEHRVGCDAIYHFNEFAQISLGAYQYRIMDDFLYIDSARSYIRSNGGFLTLRLQY